VHPDGPPVLPVDGLRPVSRPALDPAQLDDPGIRRDSGTPRPATDLRNCGIAELELRLAPGGVLAAAPVCPLKSRSESGTSSILVEPPEARC